MPNTKSALKALRQDGKRQVRNLRIKRTIKSAVKDTRSSIASGAEDALKKIHATSKILDKAAKSGFIKKNVASRKKSRLYNALNKATHSSKKSA